MTDLQAIGDTTVVGNTRFLDPVSGPGDFFGPGVTIFAGGYFPGNSPGIVEFEGDVGFGASNLLEIEIDGLALGEFDRLEVLGDVAHDGLLDVVVGDDFQPLPGDLFDIATHASSTGTFADIVIDGSLVGLGYDVVYGDTVTSLLPTRLLDGDANFDGTVSILDFAILRGDFGDSGRSGADFNGDGVISILDFAILRANFGSTLGGGVNTASAGELAMMDAWAATVPEPASMSLLLAGGALLRRRR